MEAGKLDRRVTLLARVVVKNGFSEGVETWPGPGLEVWSSYEPVKDAERLRAAEVAATITARFQIRWSPDVAAVDETWRLAFDGRLFDVVAVKELGRREGLEISGAARAERST